MATLKLTVLLSCFAVVFGSHFEGGTMSWKVTSGYTVFFDWAQGWRLGTGPCGSGCSTSSIGTFGSTSLGSFSCLSGCSGNVASIQYTVTGVNVAENWEQGSNSFSYTFSSAGPFTIGYTGNAWRSLNYGSGGNWAIQTEIFLGTRSDTGGPNASPIATASPIYRLQHGCTTETITIPMLDPNGDTVVCRWASTYAECASVCNLLPAATLASSGSMCTILVNTGNTAYVSGGWYAGAVQVDDFPVASITAGGNSYSTSTRLSSVPVQFLVYTPLMSVSCTAVPNWVTPTPATGHQYSVVAGGSITITFAAQSTSGSSMTSIVTAGPAGGSTSSMTTSGATGTVVFTWSPSSTQTGGFNLCAFGADIIGKTGTRCVAIAVAVQCADPGTPSGMTRSATAGPPFYYGHQISYTCNTGHYITSGNSQRTCQLSASFDGSSPVCTIYNCGNPGTPTNGAKSGSTYTYGASATFSCNSGYTGSGSTSRTCGTGTWSGTAHSCSRVSCGDPGAVADSARAMPGILFGDTITVTCNTGYEIKSGNAVRTCQASQAWTGSQPVCGKVICGNPGTVQNTTWTVSGSNYEYQDSVSYAIHTGYELKSGNTQRTCQATKVWTGAAPVVGRVACPALTRHNNATQTGSGNKYLDIITWSCNTGYERDSGDATVQCGASKLWNGTVLQCKRITCSSQAPHNNATQTGQGFRYQDQVSWSCNTGYEPDTGVASVTCNSNRQWSGASLTCKRITCQTLTSHNNATQTGQGFRYLDQVSWVCHNGYEKDVGDFVVQCQSNRAWNGTVLACKRNTCPTLVPHNNATQMGSAFRYLDHVSWSCNSGYEPDTGDAHVQCQANRAWNGTVQTCKRITCPTVTRHNNATQTGTAFRYLDHVSWSCHTGYEPDTGDAHVQCQANRAWNGTVQTCKRITCPTLAPHNNATQTGSGFRYLDHVSWSCNIGYEQASGDFAVQCQSNKAWNGTVLACKRRTCPTPPFIRNSSMTGTDFKYLGVIQYSPDIGYEVKSGDPIRACQATRSWNGTTPVIDRVLCNISVPQDAHISTSSPHGANVASPAAQTWAYLDWINWDCNQGYVQQAGNKFQVCHATKVFNGTVLKCVDIDECISGPCANGGNCLNTIGKFSCSCVNGYSGPLCNIAPTLSSSMQAIIGGVGSATLTGGGGAGSINTQTIGSALGTGATLNTGTLQAALGIQSGAGVTCASVVSALASVLLATLLRLA